MGLYRMKGSDKWWMSFSVGGRQVRETTGTGNRRVAEGILRKRQTEILEGRYFPDKRRSDLTVGGLRDGWLAHAAHKRSIDKDKQRFRAILAFFGEHRLIASMGAADVDSLRDFLKATETRRGGPMKPATVNRHLSLLGAALNWAKANQYHHRDPMAGTKMMAERNKRERLCSPEEYEKLLAAADPQMRIAIVLAYEQGLRREETCVLQWRRVDLKARELLLFADETKTDEPRRLPLTSRAVDELAAAARRLDGSVTGLSKNSVSMRFAKLRKSLDIEGLHFHDLRGAAITRVARTDGVTLAELMRFSGHKSVQALMRYLKTDTEQLRRIIERAEARAQ